MEDPELAHGLAFLRVRGIGARRMAVLETHFASLASACEAPRAALEAAGLDPSRADPFSAWVLDRSCGGAGCGRTGWNPGLYLA